MLRRSIASLCLASALVASLAGCHSVVVDDGNGGASSASTSETTASTTSTGSSTASTSSTSSDGGGTSTGSATTCSSFDDATGLDPVQIEVRNDSGITIYLGTTTPDCGPTHFFQLIGAGGDPPPVYQGELGYCQYSCEEVQQGACACAKDCQAPQTILIETGGKATLDWGGAVYDSGTMPSECYTDGCDGTACASARKPPTSLRVSVEAFQSADCNGSPCTCTPDASGSCTLSDFAPTLSKETSAQQLWSSGDASVVISFK